MCLTSATHADTKTFPVSAVFALSSRGERDCAVARLTTREVHVVVGVSQKERLQTITQHNEHLSQAL